MSTTEVIETAEATRTETFDADGELVAVHIESKLPPPPPPPDPAVLRAQINKATTVPQLRGALLAALDYLDANLPD